MKKTVALILLLCLALCLFAGCSGVSTPTPAPTQSPAPTEAPTQAPAPAAESVEKGAVNSIVRLSVLKGLTVSATISNNAVEELGLESGKDALAVVKATSVMIGID